MTKSFTRPPRMRRRAVAFIGPTRLPPVSSCSDEEILFVPRNQPQESSSTPCSGGSSRPDAVDDYISNIMGASPPSSPNMEDLQSSFAQNVSLFLQSDKDIYISGNDEPNESFAWDGAVCGTESSLEDEGENEAEEYMLPVEERGQLPDIFDSECSDFDQLKSQLVNKKKLKRQQRDIERMQGLLGKKKKEKARDSYVSVDISLINTQIRQFVDDKSSHSLVFPPMKLPHRRTIHLLAVAYNLKSKSSGSGKHRCPILYRTKKTCSSPNERMIASILYKQRGQTQTPKVSSSKMKPWVKDGEIVGKGAPEIAENNKGRRMLESLGWKTGMVLGASSAQSINLNPVQAIVKNNKFGLG